jgi:hypothetical protein
MTDMELTILVIEFAPMILAVVFVNALYSTSVLDRDTVSCFFAFQEMRLFPRNIANPPVDLLSSTLHAQSASE